MIGPMPVAGGMLNEMDLGEAEFFAENGELGRVEEKVEELRAREQLGG